MLGEVIRGEREKRGLSQRQLALDAGVSRKHLSDLENGANVSVRILELVASALGVAEIPLKGLRIVVDPASRAEVLVDLETVRDRLRRVLFEAGDALTTLSEARPAQTRSSRGAAHTLANAAIPDLISNPPPDAPFAPLNLVEMVEVPIVGYVAAGAPVDLLNDGHGETRSVPVTEVPEEGWVALVARGDSMIEFGIEDGDVVYVEPRRGGVAASGEIVIGWLVKDGHEGLVIKEWERRNRVKRLISWNKEYPPTEITKDDVWDLQAIVRGRVPRQKKMTFPNLSGKGKAKA